MIAARTSDLTGLSLLYITASWRKMVLKCYGCLFLNLLKIYISSSSSSDDDDDGSSGSDNQDAQLERSQEPGTVRLHSSLYTGLGNAKNISLTPNHNKSMSTPHTGQNIQVHPVVKSSSNPAVDKQAMGITSGEDLDFSLRLGLLQLYFLFIK